MISPGASNVAVRIARSNSHKLQPIRSTNGFTVWEKAHFRHQPTVTRDPLNFFTCLYIPDPRRTVLIQ